MCREMKHYHLRGDRWVHMEGTLLSRCELVKFRAIPDTVPDMLATTFHDDPPERSEVENEKYYSAFTSENIKKTPYPDGLKNDGRGKNNPDYASAYDRE